MKIIQKKKTIAGLVRVTIDMYISSIIKHNKFVICAFLHLHMSGNFLFLCLIKTADHHQNYCYVYLRKTPP